MQSVLSSSIPQDYSFMYNRTIEQPIRPHESAVLTEMKTMTNLSHMTHHIQKLHMERHIIGSYFAIENGAWDDRWTGEFLLFLQAPDNLSFNEPTLIYRKNGNYLIEGRSITITFQDASKTLVIKRTMDTRDGMLVILGHS